LVGDVYKEQSKCQGKLREDEHEPCGRRQWDHCFGRRKKQSPKKRRLNYANWCKETFRKKKKSFPNNFVTPEVRNMADFGEG